MFLKPTRQLRRNARSERTQVLGLNHLFQKYLLKFEAITMYRIGPQCEVLSQIGSEGVALSVIGPNTRALSDIEHDSFVP